MEDNVNIRVALMGGVLGTTDNTPLPTSIEVGFSAAEAIARMYPLGYKLSTAQALPDSADDVYVLGFVPSDSRGIRIEALSTFSASSEDGSIHTVWKYFGKNPPTWADVEEILSYPGPAGWQEVCSFVLPQHGRLRFFMPANPPIRVSIDED